MTTVIIGGDVCPSSDNLSYFMSGDARSVFNDLLDEFEKSDLVVANLECPLIEDSSPIKKHGPVLGADIGCKRTLSGAGIDVLNLANNHIMDHGRSGLESTLRACSGAGIATVGAGRSLSEARRILIRNIKGLKVAVMGMAEREFSAASNNSWGANSLDAVDFVRNISKAKKDYDYLIVLVHGGNEHYPYPSPRMKNVCRFLVEMGANAVIVQHTHCPGCFEDYQSGHIVYGQGNLIFDQPGREKSFYEGFLVRLNIADDRSSTMDIVPYKQSNGHLGAKKMKGAAEAAFREAIAQRCALIKDDDLLMEQWLAFCEAKKNTYLSGLLGHGRLIQRLNRSGRFVKHLYSKKSLLRTRNLLTCDAHREVLETIFERSSDESVLRRGGRQ